VERHSRAAKIARTAVNIAMISTAQALARVATRDAKSRP
jgi:hypothetical protein